MRPLPRAIAVLALFALASILMTWPLALNLHRAAADGEDPFLNAFLLHWDFRATFTDPLSLYDAPIFHPAEDALAFSENLYGIALLFFPLFAFGASPLTVHSVGVIAGFALSGFGAYLLCRRITRATLPAIAGGLFFAFLPYRFVHLTHLQHIWSVWLPLLLLAILAYRAKPSPWRAAAFGAVLLMNGLSNVHWLLFGTFAAACTVAFLIAATGGWRRWVPLVVASLVALALLVPFLLPYQRASQRYGMTRTAAEATENSATPSDWIMVGGRPHLYRTFRGAERPDQERNLGWGVVPLLLVAAGVLLARRKEENDVVRPPRPSRSVLRALDGLLVAGAVLSYLAASAEVLDLGIGRMSSASVPAMAFSVLLLVRFWLSGAIPERLRRSRFSLELWCAILWTALGVLGSLGMHAFFHQFLWDHLTVFQSIRVPARWAMIAYVGISVLVAAGASFLMQRLKGARVMGIVLAALILAEFLPAPVRYYAIDPRPPEVYRWLRDAPVSGAVLEIPTEHASDEYGYLLWATVHRKPLVNGVSGFTPPTHRELERRLFQKPVDDRTLDYLERSGCSLVIVHADRLLQHGPAIRQWLQLEMRRGRLIFLRRLDHGFGGDFLFAVAKREPNIAALRAPEVADAAGRTPAQNLQIFLAGEGRTYVGTTFGLLHAPGGGTVAGPLEVFGWALSPHGVREVNLLLGNGRLRSSAKLAPFPGLTRDVYPWYPGNERPAFSARFEEPPWWIQGPTDIQVEIVDGRGARTLLDDVWFDWLDRERNPKRRWQPERRSLPPSVWKPGELEELVASLGADPAAERPAIIAGRASIDSLIDRWIEQQASVPDGEFLVRAYRALIQRDPDPAGRDFYLRKLKEGASRRDVADAIVASGEFAQVHALE